MSASTLRELCLSPFKAASSARLFLYPSLAKEYLSLAIPRKLKSATREYDPFYFVKHKHHLSKRFTLRQRIRIALNHHKFEAEFYDQTYDEDVYRGAGVTLWAQRVEDDMFDIHLSGTEKHRNEGELSLTLRVNGQVLWRMSFTYLNGEILKLKDRSYVFLARNQAENSAHRKLFSRGFGQNQPQMFCLSALCGVALATGSDSLLAVRHDSPIAYVDALDSGFFNSYTRLWREFGGREIEGHVFEVAVPLTITPLDQVSRAHRARARARRGYWDAISRSAQAALSRYRRV